MLILLDGLRARADGDPGVQFAEGPGRNRPQPARVAARLRLAATTPDAWKVGNFSTTTRNSGILVALTVIGVLVLGGMAAYSLAKLDLPGGRGHALPAGRVVASVPALPGAALLPLAPAGAGQQPAGLAIIYVAINAPLAIFLLRSYMIQLPRDFEDAARVDGANEWRIFTRIVVPLSWPGFLTVGLVVALSVWNEFLLATVFLTHQELSPSSRATTTSRRASAATGASPAPRQ